MVYESKLHLLVDCLVELIQFVENQSDKSKEKVAGALKEKFKVDEAQLESLLRVGVLKEYRGIDERQNGIDFIGVGERAKIFLRLDNAGKVAQALVRIGI